MLKVSHIDGYPVFINPYTMVSVYRYENDDYTTITFTHIGGEKASILLVTESPEDISAKWSEVLKQLP